MPATRTGFVAFRATPTELERIKQQAAENGRTVSQEVRYGLGLTRIGAPAGAEDKTRSPAGA